MNSDGEMNGFCKYFYHLTGHQPMRWQQRLFDEHFVDHKVLPSAVSIPTGLGKTAVMAIWLIALAQRMKDSTKPGLSRRLVYVVDRRAVVDQATRFAEVLRDNLTKPEVKELAQALGLVDVKLPISTLRGQFVDNREWLEDPVKPAIIVGTVDMIGSRLLFEGYGVSRKMRPYHAGLLGSDALVLLDEAHLVPPFEALLSEVTENIKRYGPKEEDLVTFVPKFQLLPLSATARRRTAQPFTLRKSDFCDDSVVVERLSAKKRLILQELGDNNLEEVLAEKAWALFADGAKPVRIIVYCNSREMAEKVKIALDKKAKNTPVQGNTELFVGARRVRERVEAEKRLQALGFLAGDCPEGGQSAFLVATSAGEVGVDLDADHMVCDLVAWERMVQRLGRVNRRGGKERKAEIVVVVESEPEPKKKATKDALDKPETQRTDKERKAVVEHEKLLEEFRSFRIPFGKALPTQQDGSFDVSPEAMWQLNERAGTDENLFKIIAKASSKPPLRPALNRALVDAWAMTSLLEHTGRPEVDPWLRGWVNDDPQTTVVWRSYLPVRIGTQVSKKEIEDFFEAAPIHISETLETESYRVMKWLQARAGQLGNEWKPDSVVGMLIGVDGELVQTLRLRDISGDSKEDKKRCEKIQSDMYGKVLIMDTCFGGLRDGLLNEDVEGIPVTADGSETWIVTETFTPLIRFRILEKNAESDEVTGDDWRESLRFDLERNADGEAIRWLSVQKWRDASHTENDRAEGRPQALVEHQSWAAERANAIGKRLGLPDDYVRMLCIAARLHDEGKRAQRWQRAFRAERDAVKLGMAGQPLAKTRGPINQAVLAGYRHEFGSLPYAKEDVEFKKLPVEMQDLVLHLIAAHHGFARPLISTDGCEDAPPSVLEERAREVALRFARLQNRWGTWGLAWWEALLRAADVQASRANEAGRRQKENH